MPACVLEQSTPPASLELVNDAGVVATGSLDARTHEIPANRKIRERSSSRWYASDFKLASQESEFTDFVFELSGSRRPDKSGTGHQCGQVVLETICMPTHSMSGRG